MAYTAITSIKGSPGATTTAWALARTLAASDHACVLADADRFGGTLGPALGLAGMPSIRTLATAVMRAPDPDAVASYVQPVEYNLAVLVGLTSLEQSVALDPAWPNVANSLAGIDDAVVIVDVGRLPDTRSGAAALCRTASRLLVVSRPEPASAVFLSSWQTALRGIGPQVGVVLISAKPSQAESFAEATGFDVLAVLPEMNARLALGQARDIPGKGSYRKAIEGLAALVVSPVESETVDNETPTPKSDQLATPVREGA